MRWLDDISESVDGHEVEQALRIGEGQGGLACCGLGGHKELDTTV